MNWQDTVMKITVENIDKYRVSDTYEVGDIHNPITVRNKEWDLKKLLLDQAELTWDIAFEAGQDSVFDSMPENLPPLLETAHRTGKQEGIKEVVDWLLSHTQYQFKFFYQFDIEKDEWQAKLGEWLEE